jgi:small subunit ribosomal protein S7
MKKIKQKNIFEAFCGNMIKEGRKVKSVQTFFETVTIMKLDDHKPIPTAINRFKQVVDMIEPVLNMRPRKIAGQAKKIPYRMNPINSKRCGIRWFFRVARKRSEKFIFDRFFNTAMDTVLERHNGLVAKYRDAIADDAIINRTILRFRRRKKVLPIKLCIM